MGADLFRVILPVDAMAESDAFWTRMLDLPVDRVVPTRHYFHTGGAILALVDPREHGRSPVANPDCLYFRMPDLDRAWERARELGCPPGPGYVGEGIQEWPWGDRSFYTMDPAGNPVCFLDDVRSETPASATRYTGSEIANLYKAVLPTSSIGRSGAFFEELLGLDLDASVPNRHFLYCDSCVLALVDPVEHARGHDLGSTSFRPNPDLVYFGVSDLDAAFERARKLGMSPLGDGGVGEGIRTRPWGERSFYGLDPSGNPICCVDDQTLFTGQGADPGPL